MHPKKLLYSMIGLFFVGFTFLSPGAVALARQVTATITATFIPPSVTPTTMYNFECPVGTPAGWGTYTPSPLWYLECEYCVWTPTSTALPPTITPTHDGTGTPYPTSTITVTPSITGTPTGEGMHCIDLVGSYSCWTGSIDTYDYDFSTAFGNATYDELFVVAVPETYSSVTFYYSYDITFTWSGAHSLYAPSPLHEVWARNEGEPNWAKFLNNPLSGCVAGVSGSCHFEYEGQHTFTLQPGKTLEFAVSINNQNVAYPAGVTVLSGNAYVSVVGFVTPTPQVTPAGYGFCQTVAPIDPAFGFELFVPDGPANCDMGWDEFGVGDYTIPAVQICFQPSQFGVIRLFGKDYEVGIYGLAAAAAFLWRYFRTV